MKSTEIADCRVSPLATPGRRTQLERIVELEAVVRVLTAENAGLRERLAAVERVQAATIAGDILPPPTRAAVNPNTDGTRSTVPNRSN